MVYIYHSSNPETNVIYVCVLCSLLLTFQLANDKKETEVTNEVGVYNNYSSYNIGIYTCVNSLFSVLLCVINNYCSSFFPSHKSLKKKIEFEVRY